jgi:hypothetical protein
MEAMRERCLVRFSRRFEQSKCHGYVLDVGSKFFLFGLVTDRIWLDGFECFRINDVSNLKPDPHAEFVEAALKKRGERTWKKPRVNVQSIGELIRTAGRAFPLATIHREQIDPNVCWIGHVVDVQARYVSLLEINPAAIWDKKPNKYRLGQITRVSFGGDYEKALYLVGGDPAAG